MKKGWITGNSNPNTAQAARVILQDYTTGKLVFCHLRPDFDKDKHQYIIQSGFNLVSIADNLDPVQLAVIQQDSATEVSAQAQSSSTQPTVEDNQPGQDLNCEDDLDKVFFASTQDAFKKLKLNKGEKRALKFMIQRETGDNIDINEFLKGQSVPELKAMLTKESKKMEQMSHKLHYEKTGAAKKIGKNNSNKVWDFKDMMEGESD